MSTASESFPVKIIGDLIVKKIEVTDYPLGRWMELPANGSKSVSFSVKEKGIHFVELLPA